VSYKSHDSLDRWVYLDVCLFGGLIEALGEAIQYPVLWEVDSDGEDEVILAGPTCDSMDILYEDHRYQLPVNLEEGDRLYWFLIRRPANRALSLS